MGFNHAEFARERDRVLLSLDQEKIVSFCRKYGIYYPHTEMAFWESVHKARIALKDFPQSEREASKRWLQKHGFAENADKKIEVDKRLS